MTVEENSSPGSLAHQRLLQQANEIIEGYIADYPNLSTRKLQIDTFLDVSGISFE